MIRLLFIEDDPAHALLFRELLQASVHEQCEVVVVPALSAAFDALAAGGFDVILSDLGLSDSNGLDTVTGLLAAAPDVPLVVLSALESETLATRAVQLGAQDYLVKGRFGVEVLERVICYAIARHRSELARSRSESKYRTLVEQASDGIFVANLRGELVEVNPQACSMLGYTAEELLALPARDLLAASEDPSVTSRIAAGETVRVERELRRKDGSMLVAEISARLIDGQLLLAIARDITERKGMEAQITRQARESEAQRVRLASILEQMPAGVFIAEGEPAERTMRWVFINRAGQAQLAAPTVTPGAVSETFTVYHPDGRPFQDEELPIQWALWTGDVHDCSTMVFRYHTGEERIFECTIGFLQPEGPTREVIEVLQDITQRHRMEQELRESEQSFRMLFDNNPMAMWVYDAQTLEFLEVNEAAVRRYGYSRDEFSRMRITDIRPQEDVPRLLELLTAPRAPIQRSGEWRHVTRDGQVLDVNIVSHTFELGGRRAVLVVVEDITDRKRAEEARLAKEAAERANVAKSQFISRMSHEFRTPLNAVLGFAQLLEMGQLDGDDREAVAHILAGGRHLLNLINDILDLARLEAGRLSLVPEPVDPHKVLHEALELIAPQAAQRRIKIELEIAGLAELRALADSRRLKQVLLNLLSNAVKYNREHGSIQVSYSRVDPGRLRLIVQDTGRGIDPEKLDKLFAPFERMGAESGGVEGSGLGLAISSQLAEAMGGHLGVTSTPGVGSTFWIELREALPE